MTPEERKQAAEVMQSNGPWDYRERTYDAPWLEWNEGAGTDPVWNWARYEYRARPQPQYIWLNVYRRTPTGELLVSAYSCLDTAKSAAGCKLVARLKVPFAERFDE